MHLYFILILEIIISTARSGISVSSLDQSCQTICVPVDCSMPGLPVHHQLPEFTQTHVHELTMPSNHPILCCPLLLLPSCFPASGSFPMSHFFLSCDQNIGASAPAYILPMSYSGLISLGLTDLISLLSQESCPVPQFESIKSLALSLLYGPAVISVHDYWKNIPLTRWTFVG